jgi:hypothetical protein
MSKARHHMKKENHAQGGMAGKNPMPYNAQGSEVEKEAEEKAAGGRTKRASGGRTGLKVGGAAMHGKRHDRPGRKRGGAAGADMHPLTTASKVTNAHGHDATEGNAEEG